MDLPADNERPEWEALLAAVRDATGTFTMMELGAGYGRWTLRAHDLAAAAGLTPELIAVEADPGHFHELQATVNGRATLINAAVARRSGRTLFCAGGTGYGQAIPRGKKTMRRWRQAGGQIRLTRATSLNQLLRPLEHVDLIDLDVQGAEAEILTNADLRSVRRIHVGTHSPAIEQQLRDLFAALGWECEHDYPGGRNADTPWGRIRFDDGAQTWHHAAS